MNTLASAQPSGEQSNDKAYNRAFNWAGWSPREKATLLFVIEPVIDPSRILLIEKKRGLGAGLINGPGGRLEPGETPLACAVRETREELCIDVLDPQLIGTLKFQFVGSGKLSGHSILGYVFHASRFTGTPTETNEAVPLWTPLDAIPYHKMWKDDALWLPLVIARQPFAGRFVFDDQTMLEHDVQTCSIDDL